MPAAANSADFARLPEGEVREDERYLHVFFQQKKPKKSKKGTSEDVFQVKESLLGEWMRGGDSWWLCVAAMLSAEYLLHTHVDVCFGCGMNHHHWNRPTCVH